MLMEHPRASIRALPPLSARGIGVRCAIRALIALTKGRMADFTSRTWVRHQARVAPRNATMSSISSREIEW
jgi:hypothetical protein